jgi:hypothetical protein
MTSRKASASLRPAKHTSTRTGQLQDSSSWSGESRLRQTGHDGALLSQELYRISYLNLYWNFNRDEGYTFGFHSLRRSPHRNAMKPTYASQVWFHSKQPNLWNTFFITKFNCGTITSQKEGQ